MPPPRKRSHSLGFQVFGFNFSGKEKGFTLSEVLVTLTILGIVASITVPGIMQKQTEKANKTKIKKALATYEAVINKIVVANSHIRSVDSLNEFGKNDANCSNAMSYFKVTEQEGCVFRTSDGLWWDIGENGTISKTIVSFKKEDLTAENALNEGSNKAFYFVTDFENDGVMRIEDINYGWSKGNVSHSISSSKVYGFINGENYYKFCEGNNNKSCMKKTGGSETCETIGTDGSKNNSCRFYVYDEKGNIVLDKMNCDKNGMNCTNNEISKTTIEDGFRKGEILYKCDVQGKNCKYKRYYNDVLDLQSFPQSQWGNVYSYSEIWEYCDTNDTDKSTCDRHTLQIAYKDTETGISNIIKTQPNGTYSRSEAFPNKDVTYHFGCNEQGLECSYTNILERASETSELLYTNCDINGKNCQKCTDNNTEDDVKCEDR